MLIGLSGKRGAGKDTIANALVDDHGFVRVAFADALKDMLRSQDPLVLAAGSYCRLDGLVSLVGWDVAKQSPDVRQLLQRAGQWIFKVDPMFWVKAAAANMPADRDIVITDVRFDHELTWLRERGGVLVRIDRADHVVVDADRSETEADAWAHDVVIRNDGPGKSDAASLAHALLEEVRELPGRRAWAA